MFKCTGPNGELNIAGKHIREYRLAQKMSLRTFSAFLQTNGLDWDYVQLRRAEVGLRAINDLEIKKIAEITKIPVKKLLEI